MAERRARLRVTLLIAFAALVVAVVAAVVAGGLLAATRATTPAEAASLAALIAGMGGAGAVVALWYRLDMRTARPADTLAALMRARGEGGVNAPMPAMQADLGDLPAAAAALAGALARTRDDLAQAGARETARLGAEKARLETLLSDVPVAVLLCRADHQIVFYNGQAAELLGQGGMAGLDRTALDYLRPGPIQQAYDRLASAGDRDLASDLMCTTRRGGHVLSGRMRVLRRTDPGDAPGYVLTLRDMTEDVAAHSRRDRLLGDLLEAVRRPAAALQMATQAMQDAGEGAAPALRQAAADEARALTAAVTRLSADIDAAQAQGRPLVSTRVEDLWDSLIALFETRGMTLRCTSLPLIAQLDGFELVALLTGLAQRLKADLGASDFAAELIEEDGPGGILCLSWAGASLGVGRLESWLAQPLGGDAGDLTGATVLHAHGTQIWPEPLPDGRARLVMPVLSVRRATQRPAPVMRKVVYDFDLMGKKKGAALADTPLRDLTFVVFDSETTGLDSARDQIVQIAAVRVVNARRVTGEVLDTLVDPGRPIPAASTAVHGITDSMVVGAPTPAQAVAQFHGFATGAVLVAHNAPFDMAFLRREQTPDHAFDHPILDTVLLSAVVFGQLEQHSLDALTERLGITIPEADRHTALGDTIATADALVRLIPMLESRGLTTFGQVVAEGRKHGRLIQDLNG